MRLLRTFLFAPGNRPRMLQKVGQCGADAVILDLEDAVPIAEKEATRPAVRAAAQAITTCAVYIRINPLVAATSFSQAIGAADLQALSARRWLGSSSLRSKRLTRCGAPTAC